MSPDNQSDAVEIYNSTGLADLVLVCEHASNFIPAELHNLGMAKGINESHAAWDPGALNVAKMMSTMIDATIIAPKYSRLIYDCNRPPESPGAMPEKSEIYDIPGNCDLTPAMRAERVARFYNPYLNALSDLIATHIMAGRKPALVTIHSFTPVFHGNLRAVEIGFIHDANDRLAKSMMAKCQEISDFEARINDPYGPDDGVTHTLKTHGVTNGLENVMIEIRNDLIADSKGQQTLAELLVKCLEI